MKINSVLGLIDTADLGFTLMHEHIANIDMNMALAIPGWYDKATIIEKFCAEMTELKALGVRTFVDATPITLGRDITLLQECSRRTGVNILACTGTYYHEYPWFSDGIDPNILADIMIKESNEGMQGTGVKPAFIKCATDHVHGTSEANKNMIKAAGIAAKETGLPIYTHAAAVAHGLNYARYQQEILVKEGVEPARIAFGHMFQLAADGDMPTIIEDGSYLGYDQLAFCPPQLLAAMAKEITAMMKSAVRTKLFFSTDLATHTDFGSALLPNHGDNTTNSYCRKDGRKSTLFDAWIPMLMANGVTQAEIDDVFVGNPRRFFEGI